MAGGNNLEFLILPRFEYTSDTIKLRPIQPSEIQQIRVWRNSQTQILRQISEISPSDQLEYFEHFVFPEYQKLKPNLMLFSIFDDKEFIGYGGLVHLDWANARGEISFLLNPEISEIIQTQKYASIFREFLKLVYFISFIELGLNKLTTETYGFRELHLEILEGSGMSLEGELIDHVKIGGTFYRSFLHRKLRSEFQYDG